MLTPEQIRTFIETYRTSKKRLAAQEGQDYYDGKHDILQRRIFYVNDQKKLVEDTLNSNIRISHPFFTENVDQTVQYIMSGEEGFMQSDDPALQEMLDERFNNNDDFKAQMYFLLTGSAIKGWEYLYHYTDEQGRTAWDCADSLGVVEVRKAETDDHCEYLIRWWVERTDAQGREIRKVEVWDDATVTFYEQIDDGEITLDEDVPLNPRPHTLYTKKGKTYVKKGEGHIPFIKLPNNQKETSDLVPIKDVIDDYDLMNVDLSNSLQNTNESIYVIKGFDGDNLDEVIFNTRAKKHVGVPEGGDLDIKTIDIPVEARRTKMDIDIENIYRFGMAVDPSGLKDTAAKTSIEIKMSYFRLDLKAKKKIILLKQCLRKVLDVVLAEINENEGTDYQQKDVQIVFKPEVPTNALENAQIDLTEAQKTNTVIQYLLDLATFIDDETRLKLICDELGVEFEEIKDKLPKPEDMPLDPAAAQNMLSNAPTEPTMPIEPEVTADE